MAVVWPNCFMAIADSVPSFGIYYYILFINEERVCRDAVVTR